MANRTDKAALDIHGTNPQFLVEKIIRTRIYASLYWKEECFALTAATIVDKVRGGGERERARERTKSERTSESERANERERKSERTKARAGKREGTGARANERAKARERTRKGARARKHEED